VSKTKLLGSAADLAAWLGVSERRVGQLADENIAVKVARAVYDIRASVEGYIKLLKKNATAQGSEELLKERVLLTREKRKQAEIETAALEGKMLEADIVQRFWAQMVGDARTELLSIPTTHAGQLASEENPNQVQKLLDAAISNALNKLANYDAGKFVEEYIQEHGAEIRSATEIDGEPVGGSTPHSAI